MVGVQTFYVNIELHVLAIKQIDLGPTMWPIIQMRIVFLFSDFHLIEGWDWTVIREIKQDIESFEKSTSIIALWKYSI